MMENHYALEKSLEERIKERNKIKDLCNKVPIICILDKNIQTNKKYYKFLVNDDTNLSNLICIIRKKMNITPTEAIFFMSETGQVFNSRKSLYSIYHENQNIEDGFLYMFIYKENTFGLTFKNIII